MKKLMVIGAILAVMTPGLRAQDSASKGSAVANQANETGFDRNPVLYGSPEFPGIVLDYQEFDNILGPGNAQQIVQEYEALKEILGRADSRQIQITCWWSNISGAVVEKKQVKGLKAKDLIELHFVYQEHVTDQPYDLYIRYQERKGLVSRETASKKAGSGNLTIVDKKTEEIVGSFNTFGFSRD